MSPKVLKRCSICGKFHAAYLVEDPRLGKLNLCYSCWTARAREESEKKTPGGKAPAPKQPKGA